MFPHAEVFNLPKLKRLPAQNLLFLVIASLAVITPLVSAQSCGFVNHHHKETQSQNKRGTTGVLRYKRPGRKAAPKAAHCSSAAETPSLQPAGQASAHGPGWDRRLGTASPAGAAVFWFLNSRAAFGGISTPQFSGDISDLGAIKETSRKAGAALFAGIFH